MAARGLTRSNAAAGGLVTAGTMQEVGEPASLVRSALRLRRRMRRHLGAALHGLRRRRDVHGLRRSMMRLRPLRWLAASTAHDGQDRFGLVTPRLGGFHIAAMPADDAVKFGQRLDLVDDDAAHLVGCLSGFLRQFQDAATQFGASGA